MGRPPPVGGGRRALGADRHPVGGFLGASPPRKYFHSRADLHAEIAARGRAVRNGAGYPSVGAQADRAFLDGAGVRGTRGDQREALSWYRRARDLGDAEADRLLKSIKPD
jgi:TPR repeat protein